MVRAVCSFCCIVYSRMCGVCVLACCMWAYGCQRCLIACCQWRVAIHVIHALRLLWSASFVYVLLWLADSHAHCGGVCMI
jgi:hypothetical protein